MVVVFLKFDFSNKLETLLTESGAFSDPGNLTRRADTFVKRGFASFILYAGNVSVLRLFTLPSPHQRFHCSLSFFSGDDNFVMSDR